MKKNFEDTDISRQLKECFAPYSAYLYVENLWYSNNEIREKLEQIRTEVASHAILIRSIMEE
jgi:hypothetical protein